MDRPGSHRAGGKRGSVQPGRAGTGGQPPGPARHSRLGCGEYQARPARLGCRGDGIGRHDSVPRLPAGHLTARIAEAVDILSTPWQPFLISLLNGCRACATASRLSRPAGLRRNGPSNLRAHHSAALFLMRPAHRDGATLGPGLARIAPAGARSRPLPNARRMTHRAVPAFADPQTGLEARPTPGGTGAAVSNGLMWRQAGLARGRSRRDMAVVPPGVGPWPLEKGPAATRSQRAFGA